MHNGFVSFDLNELNQLEKLLQISQKISEIYDKLYELEITNQKDSRQYEELLKKLINEINVEKKIYKNIDLQSDRCLKYLKLISHQTQMEAGNSSVTTTLKYYDIRAYRRVFLKLFSIIETTKEFQTSIIPDSLSNMFVQLNQDEQNEILNSFSQSIKLNNILTTDIHSIFLSILEEIIHHYKYKEYKNELIKAKYCISFVHTDLENLMIGYRFNMPSSVYTSSKIANDLSINSKAVYEFTKIFQLKNKARIEIDRLLEIKDSEYLKPEININSIITQCYIRALLSLMKGNEVNSFNQEFHDKIETPEYLKHHPNDRISESIIINCFKSFNNDKKRIRMLSTKTDN